MPTTTRDPRVGSGAETRAMSAMRTSIKCAGESLIITHHAMELAAAYRG